MAWGPAVVSGLVGTAAMSLLMALGPWMGMPRMDMAGALGTMLAGPGTAAAVLGWMLHFGMGAIFAVVYALLWSTGVGAATLGWGIVFGLVHGVVAVLAMPVMQSMHPRRTQLATGGTAAMGVLVGHGLYGLVVAAVYAAWLGR